MPIQSYSGTLMGKVGETFLTTTLTHTGAVNSWSATGLPSGLAINSVSGAISGLPIAKGESSATITATGPLVALKVASGLYHTLAVKYDGTVVAWGSNFVDGGGTGPLDIPSGLNGVVDVAAGLKFSLALKSDGTVVGWGANNLGQVTIPSGLSNVIAIAAGRFHSLALKSDGSVVGWGDNFTGQIQIPYLSNIVAIAAGSFHSIALNSVGTATVWGYTKGQENGFNINYPEDYGQTSFPQSLRLSVAAIAAGALHNIAIKKDGTVVAWGRSNEGQTTIPSGLSSVSKIVTSGNYCLALKNDGTVVSWGEGSTAFNISGAIAIATSGAYSVALKTNGTLESWGASSQGPIAVDSDSISANFSIAEGVPIITPGQTASGTVGAAFSKTFSLTDSTNRPVTSWAATDLPSWATINTTTGTITGTPQDTGSATITLTATGPGGTSESTTATISIAIGAPIISSGQTFTGKVGDAFSANISLQDALDRPATAWAATGLPAGLLINSSTGAITGAPTTIGSFTASLAASNGAGSGAAQSVAFTIEAGTPIIAPSQTLNGTVGTAFSAAVALTNSANRPAASFAFSGLPSWAATNSSSGIIAGTPTAAGTTTFSVTATGPGGTSAATNVSLVISAGGGGGGGGTSITTMQLVQSQAFTANVGESFTSTPQVLSGTPVSWYASDLPDWASISASAGAITGTPTFTGTHYITVTAVDANNLSATAVIILTTVSWNTLELYIDPKNRKMLSKANTRSVLSSMVLKRDDRTPFTIVFVKDTTSFSVPSDYNIAVGIKQNYGGEYLAYADAASGLLDLTTAPVQALFEDDQEFVDAIFEVKWEDADQSAIRTITLPLKIQNSVILGNISGGTVSGPTSSVSSSLDRYLASRQKILTASSAPTSALAMSETISEAVMFHRPSTATFPAQRGWISAVSSVTLDAAPLVADEDFVFCPDRQSFYFLDADTTGDIVITGTAARNFVNFGVTIQKSVADASSTSTLIDTASPLFEITSVSITSEDMGTESPDGFYFDRTTATLFLETKFTCSSAVVLFKNALGVEFQETFAGLADASTLSVPKSLSAASVVKVALSGTEIGGEPVGDFTPFSVLENTESGDDILHLGWNYPTGYEKGQFTIEAAKGESESYTLTFPYWPGNAFELPRTLDNVHSLAGAAESLIVFDAKNQNLVFCKKQSGQLNYTATHKAYEGLANGGETLEIVAEIPGVYATTAGTGHHLSTLRTLSPSQDWFSWWYQEYGIYFVQIVDEQNVVIYQDDSQGAFASSRPGYTADELLPLTLKLPFAPLWSLSRRDDTSLFQAAFAPDFVPSAFSSATFPELDDTQRYAADSMATGKAVTLSTNKSIPVRGVQGVNFAGPKPTFYAGATVPYLVLSTYKWFVVKCTNRNGNAFLTDGKKYLLCVNNTNFESRSIMVNITNEGYNVAADLYELKEGN